MRNLYHWVEGENFRSLAKFRVDFPAGSRGLVFLRGRNYDASGSTSNGAGKSSLVESMVWCLYGVTLREDATAGGVVGRLRKGGTRVAMEFVGRDGGTYKVERSRTAKGGLKLTVARDGVDASGGDAAGSQEVIDRAMGVDGPGFLATCVFSGAFKFSGLGDKAAKEVLERVFGASDLEAALALVRDDAKAARAKQADASIQVSKAEATRDQQARAVEIAAHRSAHAGTERQQLIAQAQQALAARTAAAQQAAADRAAIGSMYAGQTDPTTGHPATITSVLRDAEALMSRVQVDMGATQAELRAARDAAAVAGHVAAVTVGHPCSTCLRPVTQDVVDLVQQHVTQQQEAAARRVEAAVAAEQMARETVNGIAQTLQALRDAQARERAAEHALTVTQNAQAAAQGELDRLLAASSDADASDQQHLQQEQAALAKVQHDLAVLQAARDAAAAELQMLDYLETMMGLRGLRSMMLDEAAAAVSAEAARVAGRMTDGTITVGIRSTGLNAKGVPDDKVHVDVTVGTGAEGYGECSRGERARADLPLLFGMRAAAVARRGVDPGILFLDEVLDEMDATGGERAVPVLSELAKECLVFVVTHMGELSGVDHVWTVAKRGGSSQVYTSPMTDEAIVQEMEAGEVLAQQQVEEVAA